MFTSARIKLTSWYLVIIMLISFFFSVAVYRGLTAEIDRIDRMQRGRQIDRLVPPNFIFRIDPDLIAETKQRIKLNLFLVNLGILSVAGVAGYFLAGRTLKPIAKMVDEQNRFIADASHELRTPLTALKTEIEVNLRDKNLNLKEAKSLLESNLEEVNQLQNLSDGLIKITQYQKNNFTKDQYFNDIDLSLLLTQAVKKVYPLALKKEIKFKKSISKVNVLGDQSSLLELVIILLDNAIKYSDSSSTVEIKLSKSKDQALLEIKDQGVGIAKEDLGNIFNRFYRVDKSRTKIDVEGFGLGLSIANQIVQEHQGVLKVESQLGKGSCFSVSLPLA